MSPLKDNQKAGQTVALKIVVSYFFPMIHIYMYVQSIDIIVGHFRKTP